MGPRRFPTARALVALVALAAAACSDDPGTRASSRGGSSDGGGGGAPAAGPGGAGGAGAGSGGGGEGGEGGGPTYPDSLSNQFELKATAAGESKDGHVLSCSLHYYFTLDKEIERTDTYVRYRGTQGGEAIRSIFDKDGDGFVFNADTFAEIEVKLEFPKTLTIDIPINATASERFWNRQKFFEGTIDTMGRGAGDWTCAPLDIEQGGYVDTEFSLQGTWKTKPSSLQQTTP